MFRFCVISCAVCYFGLIILLVHYHKQAESDDFCKFHDPCIRFCCKDQVSCDESFIRKNFKPDITHASGYVEKGSFIVKKGAPKCFTKLVDSHQPWTILGVNIKIFKSTKIIKSFSGWRSHKNRAKVVQS